MPPKQDSHLTDPTDTLNCLNPDEPQAPQERALEALENFNVADWLRLRRQAKRLMHGLPACYGYEDLLHSAVLATLADRRPWTRGELIDHLQFIMFGISRWWAKKRHETLCADVELLDHRALMSPAEKILAAHKIAESCLCGDEMLVFELWLEGNTRDEIAAKMGWSINKCSATMRHIQRSIKKYRLRLAA
jgi:hypothetical protein